jgi:hypothetical protein
MRFVRHPPPAVAPFTRSHSRRLEPVVEFPVSLAPCSAFPRSKPCTGARDRATPASFRQSTAVRRHAPPPRRLHVFLTVRSGRNDTDHPRP